MSESDSLEDLLSAADLAIHEHNIKLKSREDSQSTSLGCNYNVSDININDISTISKLEPQTNYGTVPTHSSIKNFGADVLGCFQNDQFSPSNSMEFELKRSSNLREELKELCWQLLSIASASLRENSRAHKQIDSFHQLLSPGHKRSALVYPAEDFSLKQQQVNEASSRIQHLLVEVGVIESESSDSDGECLRLCSLLTILLKHLSDCLHGAGLDHMTDSAVISPRRTSVDRQVKAACSSLDLLLQEILRIKELALHQEDRLKKLQVHVKSAEERAQEATKKLSSHECHTQETERVSQQQLQQVYLQLARDEEQLKLIQREYNNYRKSNSDQEKKQQDLISELKSDLQQSQMKLQEGSGALKEIKNCYDRLKEDSDCRIEELDSALNEFKLENKRLQNVCDSLDQQNRQSILSSRTERDEAIKKVAIIKGELESDRNYSQQLEADKLQLKHDQEDMKNNISELKEKLSDIKTFHEEEIKKLHEKLSKTSSDLCETQTSLRKEQLSTLQLRTKVELESQRAADFKLQNNSLMKQVEALNKTLQDQIDRRSSEEVRAIVKTLHDTRCKSHHNSNVQNDSAGNLNLQQLAHLNAQLLFNNNYSNSINSHTDFNNSQVQSTTFSNNIPDQNKFYTSSLNNTHNNTANLSFNRMFRSTEDLRSNSFGSSTTSTNNFLKPLTMPNRNINTENIDEHYSNSTKSFREGLQRLMDIENDMSEMAIKDTSRDLEINRRECSMKNSSKHSGRMNDLQEEKDVCEVEETVNTKSKPLDSCRSTSSANYLLPNRPTNIASVSPNKVSTTSYTRRDFDRRSVTSGESGFSSSHSTTSLSSSEVMRAREEARKERLEAAKLRERCLVLQVEVEAQKTALEDQRMRAKLKSRVNRAKREEFGQLLGSLEESFETSSFYDANTSVNGISTSANGDVNNGGDTSAIGDSNEGEESNGPDHSNSNGDGEI